MTQYIWQKIGLLCLAIGLCLITLHFSGCNIAYTKPLPITKVNSEKHFIKKHIHGRDCPHTERAVEVDYEYVKSNGKPGRYIGEMEFDSYEYEMFQQKKNSDVSELMIFFMVFLSIGGGIAVFFTYILDGWKANEFIDEDDKDFRLWLRNTRAVIMLKYLTFKGYDPEKYKLVYDYYMKNNEYLYQKTRWKSIIYVPGYREMKKDFIHIADLIESSKRSEVESVDKS